MSSFQEHINGAKPVVVDFFAHWCGPCKMMPAILREVKQSLGEEVTILTLDIDKNRRLASGYSVQAVPTLMIFKKGEVVWRKSGVVPAQELISRLTLLRS